MSLERPTSNQVRDQHDAGHKGKSVLIKRSNGSIDVGTFKGIRVRDRYIVEVSDGEESIGYKPVADEALSDESQEKLARELGGPLRGEAGAGRSEILKKSPTSIGRRALETAGIDEPAAAVEQVSSEEDQFIKQWDELREGLSETDKMALWWYAAAHYYETDSAIKNMSLSLQRDGGRLEKARTAMQRLKEIRKQSS